MKLNNRPEIVDGKPRVTWFLEEDDGTFVRDLTQADLDEINAQFRNAMLEFWRLPAGQLCEWGRPPLPDERGH